MGGLWVYPTAPFYLLYIWRCIMKNVFINKFVIIVLCSFIIFNTCSFSYAENNELELTPLAFDGGVISAPMLGVVVSLGIASGLVINSNDDIVDLGRVFYENFKDSWESTNFIFNSAITVGINGVVDVGKEFLDICFNFFDTVKSHFSSSSSKYKSIGYYQGIPVYDFYNRWEGEMFLGVPVSHSQSDFYFGDVFFDYVADNNFRPYLNINGSLISTSYVMDVYDGTLVHFMCNSNRTSVVLVIRGEFSRFSESDYHLISSDYLNSSLSVVGGENIDYKGILDKVSDLGNVSVNVPSNLGDFVGANPGDILYNPGSNPPYELPIGGVVTIPNVNNPSIDIDGSVTIPGTGVINPPVTGVWDWLVNLVVPSDSYWIDSFNNIRNNISNKFPGIDSNILKDLCVSGTPLKDHSIKIMGSGSSVAFSGTTINKISTWVQPVIQGIIAIFLIFYNYNQVYYLIRGTRPFSTGKGD